MRKIMTMLACMACMTVSAQDIKLPAVNKSRKTETMMKVLDTRHSVREYSDKELSMQDLGDLCWAACGVTLGGGYLTAPTAMNRQEIRLYVFTKKGVYEYQKQQHFLKEITKGDSRALLAGGQDFVKTAPVVLMMAIDLDILGGDNERSVMMGCVDAGNVSENVNLYCQSVGMVTVPRATMDTDKIKKLLGLSAKQLPIMNNPVGWPKK